MNLKIAIYFLTCCVFSSCIDLPEENSFCTSKGGWDYNRIPLIAHTELIRLTGSENWIFSLEKNKIDSPNISALINVQKIGINKNSFILISNKMTYNDIGFDGITIKVNFTGTKKVVVIFENSKSPDSLVRDTINYSWYNIGEVWERFNSKGYVPWCK